MDHLATARAGAIGWAAISLSKPPCASADAVGSETTICRREASDTGRTAEEARLAEHVCTSANMPRMDGPAVRQVIWMTRDG